MLLENGILRAELDDTYPVIREVLHKPTGTRVRGLEHGRTARIVVNGVAVTPEPDSGSPPGWYRLKFPSSDLTLTFSFALDGSEIVWRLEEVDESRGGRLKTLYFPEHDLVTVGPDWHYRRERFVKRPWDVEHGRGLWDPHTDSGLVGAAVPDCCPPAITYASLWNDRLCITARSSSLIKPVELLLVETDAPNRTSFAALQAGEYHYRAGEKVLDRPEFRIAFLQDINGDGKADYMDALLWSRRALPDPDPMYAHSILYKIFCALPEQVVTTFDQCLDIIRLVHLVSDGMPQIVYLVGWQYDGHDTGYPALDRVNEKLGGRERLLWLHHEAKRCNAILSYHINLDDAYPDSPAWDPGIMCVNPDGSVLEWEIFNKRMAYHVNHTKEAASGKAFERIDAMMETVPVEKTVHLDAFRITNESWEKNGYIGMVEELELGVRPIIDYLRSKGIDPSCESIDRFPAELTGLIGCVWHTDDPRIHFGKLLGGGQGENMMAWAKGGSINTDLTPDFDFGRIADMIYLGTRLYQLYLTRELMDFRWVGDQRLYMRLGDDGIVRADGREQTMHVQWGDIEVARDFDRFIPTGDGMIYAYSRGGGNQSWTLPANWEGAALAAHTITPKGVVDGPDLRIDKRRISFDAQPQRPIRLERTG